jgi:hypothetical protein
MESSSTVFSSLRLCDFSLPLKFLVTAFLVVLGVGYLISMVNLYLTYSLTDGEPGLTANDLRRAFYGDRNNTRLAAKIDGGSMEQYLPKPGEKETILSWIQDGVQEGEFEKKVQPIIYRNCVRCHSARGVSSFRPLTTYEEVMTVTVIDRGEPPQLWARVAHTHILSIGMIFFFLGIIFSFTSYRESVKSIVVLVPFVALLLDFGCRFLAKYLPVLVYLMMFTGALLGISLAFMIAIPLYEMWVKKQTAT